MSTTRAVAYQNIHGTPLNIPGMEAQASLLRVAKPKAEAPAEFHKGWRVQGHPPGAMEEARERAEKLARQWQGMTEQEKVEAIQQGDRAPAAWDERAWRTGTRKKPVRAKPYDIPDAARQCADMAIKAGWLDIEVFELKRSKKEG